MGQEAFRRAIKKPKALLIGDIQSVMTFCQTLFLKGMEEPSFEFVGIVLIEKADIGRTISGIPIIGELSDINTIIRARQSSKEAIKSIIMIGGEMKDDAEKFVRKIVSKYEISITSAKLQYAITE